MTSERNKIVWVALNAKMLGKTSERDNLKHFSYFSKKVGYCISCKFSTSETICKKYQSLVFGEKRREKNIINLSSAELAYKVINVNKHTQWENEGIFYLRNL